MSDAPQGRPIVEIIREIVTTLVNVAPERIVPEARWDDVLTDRFDFYGVLADTQRRFGIEIPDDDAFDMDTVADLIAFVESKGL